MTIGTVNATCWLAGIFLGWLCDRHFETSPVFILVGLVIGSVTGAVIHVQGSAKVSEFVNVEDPPQAPAMPVARVPRRGARAPMARLTAAAFGYAEIAAQAKRIVWPCCILGGVA